MAKKAARLGACALIVTALFFLNAHSVFAAGWWQINASDTLGSGIWNDSSTVGNDGKTSPHGGFSSSSNLCKTCHAVHGAGDSSFRLLKDGTAGEGRSQGEGATTGKGNSQATECMYCHDADSGVSSLRPYELGESSETVRGEHTLDAVLVPDSDINGGVGNSGNLPNRDPGGQGAVLSCYQCHSVHGANTINGLSYDSSDAFENWNLKILRLDPGGDGTDLAKGFGGMTAVAWGAELAGDPSAVRTGFCADCHNKNPNWATTTADSDRPNPTSHVQGPGSDALLQVNGETMTVAAHPLQKMGCRGCHYATDRTTGSSRFPHQSTGWKLLYDEATMSGGPTDTAGDPNRALPKLDAVCLSCHAVFSDLADNVEEEGDCLTCHDSKYNAPDVGDEIRKESAHPIIDFADRHKDNETAADFADGNRHAECPDCHNAQQTAPWSDTALTGVAGIGVTNGGAGTVPAYTYKAQMDTAKEYELCFKCHSSWTTQPASSMYENTQSVALTQGNKALEFNPNNNAFHPVEGAGRNVSSNLNAQLKGGLTTSSVIKCTDCHASDGTDDVDGPASNSDFRPKGPHGAANNSSQATPNTMVLRALYFTDLAGPTTWNQQNFALCFICHDPDKLIGDAEFDASSLYSNFSRDMFGNQSLHYTHLITYVSSGVTCRNCHYNIHSNQQAVNTQYRVNSTGTPSNNPISGWKSHLVSFSPDLSPVGAYARPEWRISSLKVRSCFVYCHGATMSNRQYRPMSGDDVATYTP